MLDRREVLSHRPPAKETIMPLLAHHSAQTRGVNIPASVAMRNARIVSAAKSVRGSHCGVNEDCFRMDDRGGVFVVADGLGGQCGGSLASRLVTRELMREAQLLRRRELRDDRLVDEIKGAFLRVNNCIQQVAEHLPRFRGMGASAVLAIASNGRLHVASTGDCRGYLFREDQVERLTMDQSLFQLLVNAGLAHDKQQSVRSRRMLWSCLGAPKFESPEVRSVELRHADRLVLVTNGVTRVLTDGLLARLCATSESVGEVSANVVNAARTLRTKDDATCVAVSFDSVGSEIQP